MNDGGPAFPVAYGEMDDVIEGMTLRDYFAAAALPALISAMMARRLDYGFTDEGAVYEAVQLSGVAADAMLAQREKTK